MGQPKQLLPFRGKTILECVVDTALTSALDQVVVVLGHQAEQIAPLLADRSVTITLNPDYAKGQSFSLKAGLRVLEQEIDAALFLLGDQPLIRPATIDQLLCAYRDSRQPIVMPVYEGRRGNPVLFSRETFSGIETLEEDRGARGLFDTYTDRVHKISVSDPGIHFDIDTDEDYRKFRESGGMEIPGKI